MNQTKDKILNAALQLFNQHGLPNVSQHKIAEELGISPGNLTYHFRQKENIVEAIYFELANKTEILFENLKNRASSISDLIEVTESLFSLMMKYRFIFMDITYLIRNNETIATHYRSLIIIRKKQYRLTIQKLIESGIFRKEKLPNEYEYFFTRLELITDFYLPANEVSGNSADTATLSNFSQAIIYTTYPYLTAKGISELPKSTGKS